MIKTIEKREEGKFLVENENGEFTVLKTPADVKDAIDLAVIIREKGIVPISVMQQIYFS